MPQTLLDITGEMQALDDLLVECEGDVSDESVAAAVAAWETELSANLSTKVDAYVGLIRMLELRASVRRAEAERLIKRVRCDENATKGLKGRLLMALDRLGQRKVETDRYRVSIAKNGGKQAMTVRDEDVPDDWKYQPPAVPDTDRIREALANGEELPFAQLLPRGEHINIR